MIPYNTTIYGDITVDYIASGDTEPIAAALPSSVLSYFNSDGSLYDADNMTTLDNSVYLWYINPTSAAATNAAVCTDNSVVYHAEVSENNVESAPLAITWHNINQFAGQSQTRLAYNDRYLAGSYYLSSNLFVNLNRKKFCCCPRVLIYNPYYDDYATKTLSEISSYLSGSDAQRAIIYGLQMTLFNGDTERNTNTTYLPNTSVSGRPIPDILSDRPIPDNATALKWCMHRDYFDGYHAEWIDTYLYSPFAIRNSEDWFNSDSSGFNDFTIGQHVRLNIGQIKGGKRWISNDVPSITGFYAKYTERVQEYDDVVYKWTVKCYNIDLGRYLDDDENIYNLGNSNRCELCTVLEIVDDKGDSTNAVKNALLHEAANVGFWFTDTEAKARTAVLGSESDGVGVYLPEIVNRTTTGNYFTGADIANVPYADAEGVDELPEGDDTGDSDTGDLTTHLTTGLTADGCTWFVFNQTQLAALSAWLNTTYRPDEQQLTEDFKGVNPSDYIISIKYYPFAVTAGINMTVSCGGIDTGITAPIFSRIYGKGSNSYFDLGSFVMQPPYCFKNFLDGMIKLQLYIPYCGFIDLDAALYCPSPDGTTHTISAALQVDFATGQCLGLVFRDALLIDTINGTCGVDLPLSAVAQGSYQNAIKQAEIAVKQSKASLWASRFKYASAVGTTMTGLITGNPVLAAAGAVSMISTGSSEVQATLSKESAEYALQHTAPTVNGIESAAPFNAMLSEQSARIFIYKPVKLQDSDMMAYAETVGHACCMQGALSNFHGLTVCSSVNLNVIDAPAHHKQAIQQALLKGVYLP